MGRIVIALVMGFMLTLDCAYSQNTTRAPASQPKNEGFHGLRLTNVPEVVYAQVPHLPKGQGLLVRQVKSDSPAGRAGLKLHDILLLCNGKKINDGDQFAALILNTKLSKGEKKVPVLLLRGGKEVTLAIGLTVLQELVDTGSGKYTRGNFKIGRPPAVSVKATSQRDGSLLVTFEYYSDGKGKLRRSTFSGSLEQIEAKVEDLPMPVQDLARVALKRLRAQKEK